MDGSYLLQMNLRSGHRSTSFGVAHGLGEGQGESGRAIEHGSGGVRRFHLWLLILSRRRHHLRR